MIKRVLIIVLIPTLLLCGTAQATTLRQMQVMVYEMLDADSTNRVLDSITVRRMIDYAQAEVAADGMCIVTTKRAVLARFTASYLVDSNMVLNGVLGVYVEDYEGGQLNALRGLERHRLKDFSVSGQKDVNWFDIVGYNVFVNVIPAAADTTDTLVVKYAENATALTISGDGSSVLEIPKDFELALSYKACALLYLSRQMSEIANVFEQYYEKEIAKRRRLYPAAVTDSPVVDQPASP